MKVLCIDSSNKPSQIPNELWIEKDRIYTVKSVISLPLQPGIAGFLLEEVSLSPECFPYEFYSSKRFVVVTTTELEEEESELLEEELTI